MSIQSRYIKDEVHKYIPYIQKRFLNKIVSVTIRMLADEYQRSPYEFVSWLGRYQGTINIFADDRRAYDTSRKDRRADKKDEESIGKD